MWLKAAKGNGGLNLFVYSFILLISWLAVKGVPDLSHCLVALDLFSPFIYSSSLLDAAFSSSACCYPNAEGNLADQPGHRQNVQAK